MNTDLAVISFIFAFISAVTACLAAVIAWLIYKTGADKKDIDDLRKHILDTHNAIGRMNFRLDRIQKELHEAMPELTLDPDKPLKRRAGESDDEFLDRLIGKINEGDITPNAARETIKLARIKDRKNCETCKHAVVSPHEEPCKTCGENACKSGQTNTLWEPKE